MLWRDRRQSENVEDRRGISGGGLAVGGGLGGIVVLVIALLLGADPRDILEQAPANDSGSPATSRPVNPEETELRQFVGAALADTEDVWTDIFRKSGRQYPEPKLVFIYGSGQVRVWSRRRGGRSILLSERSEGLY